nr:hypothetical protein [uncultured Bdellovibrio sp.]
MKLLRTQKGQGVIEATLTLPLLVVVGTVFTLLLYRGMVFYFADYNLHEALICGQSSHLSSCEQELRNRISKVLIINIRSDIRISKRGKDLQGKISIDFTPPLEIEKTLKGPRSW